MQVAEAAVDGRVAILLIEAERQISGLLGSATGRVQLDDLARPRVDDQMDDLGELVLKRGGEVVVVPAEHIPTRKGISAIYRL